ncbi:hypothetical protein DL98DRAFT_542950 [Cadophora sp. DSE1049]|nr:hypothetical protein DL98DRAFT_542950 [Cadophora sp. DSE1049]
MNAMFLFQIQGINHNSMLAGVLWWAYLLAGLAGYYQSFAFLITPVLGVTSSYSQPNELNTATGVMFLTWSIWFAFTTSLIALRSEYTIYLTLIFASVAITTGLVGTSHLVAATSEQVPAFRLQRSASLLDERKKTLTKVVTKVVTWASMMTQFRNVDET